MADRRRTEPEDRGRRRRPATTPEGRENHMIALAQELAEKRIREGNASAQEIVHFLKLGSSREKLEQERLAHENRLLQSKREALDSQKVTKKLYARALTAMRRYSTGEDLDEDVDDYEDGDDYED